MSAAPLTRTGLYRSLLRQHAASSIQPRPFRSASLLLELRSLVEALPAADSKDWSRKASELLEVANFMKSQRLHSELLERYNPTHGMTVQERTKATARRVGLDVPKPGQPM